MNPPVIFASDEDNVRSDDTALTLPEIQMISNVLETKCQVNVHPGCRLRWKSHIELELLTFSFLHQYKLEIIEWKYFSEMQSPQATPPSRSSLITPGRRSQPSLAGYLVASRRSYHGRNARDAYSRRRYTHIR